MRVCQGCTSAIADNVLFCPICGKKQEMERKVSNMYCTYCGNALHSQMKQCAKCGAPNTAMQTQVIFQDNVPQIVKQFSIRLTAVAVLWICIAALQFLMALLMVICFVFVEASFEYVWSFVICASIGAVNLCSAIKDIRNTVKYKKDFVGIIREYKFGTGSIMTLLYNAYVIWESFLSTGWLNKLMGFVFLVGVVCELVFVHLYVYINKNKFIQLERAQLSN